MKLVAVCISLLLSSVVFAQNQYVYKVRLPAGAQNCADQASAWAEQFHQATGATLVSADCRGQVTVTFENQKYTLNSLALTYSSDSAFSPYVAEIGRENLFAPIEVEQTMYSTYAECLADLETQGQSYRAQTGLVLVSSSCELENPGMRKRYVLHIEGFDRNRNAHPQKRLFTFVPSVLGAVSSEIKNQIKNMITTKAATVVKENADACFSYYAQQPLNINGLVLAFLNNKQECESQIEQAQSILQKLKATQSIVWCDETNAESGSRLQVISDANQLHDDNGTYSTHYYSFQECMNDRDFVLSDTRRKDVVGAICSPSLLSDGDYRLHLYTPF